MGISIRNPPSLQFIPAVGLLIVSIVTVAVYWPGLSGPLLLDDLTNLYPVFRFGDGLITWKETFNLSLHGSDRPVSILSFMGNALLSPGNIRHLKFTNLLIHLACGLLIYRLCFLLLYKDVKNDLHKRYIALGVTALWLLSPFLLSTVLYVIQRMAQLSALFTLCGLVLYTTGRINLENDRKPAIGLIGISLVLFWPLATLSKQNGILLPLLMLVIEFFFFQDTFGRASVRKLRAGLICLACLPLLAVGAGIFILDYPLLDYSGRDFTLYERLLTQSRVLLDYMGNLLLIPGASPMSLFHDDYVKSTGLLAPVTTLPCLLFSTVILTTAFIVRGKRAGILLSGIVFFYAAHIVESTFIPLELYFEHRNYLPAFSVYFSAVYGMYLLLERIKFQKFAIVFLLIFPLTFSILTWQRAMVWQKEASIYFISHITHPDSPRINEGLAYLYLKLNDPDKSIYYLDKAIALKPGQKSPDFYFKYLLAWCRGNVEVKEEDLRKLNFHGLADELTTIGFFRIFIEEVEAGKCDSLALDSIADRLKSGIADADKEFGTKHVKSLLSRLMMYLGRYEETGERVN